MTDLLQAAREAVNPREAARLSVSKWLPVVIELRRKNFTYRDIYQFLQSHGEAVQKNEAAFIVAMARCYRNHINQQIQTK